VTNTPEIWHGGTEREKERERISKIPSLTGHQSVLLMVETKENVLKATKPSS